MAQGNNHERLKRLVRTALFAALLCLLSPMVIPIKPIPISLGLFAVLLTGAMLDFPDGAAATLLYLFLGGIGLPVFSGGGAGFGVLIGPTGGYLWSYPLVALLVGFGTKILFRKMAEKKLIRQMLGVFLLTLPGVLLCYIAGTAQYMIISGAALRPALAGCVLPFIPIDLCKCLAVAIITPRVRAAL